MSLLTWCAVAVNTFSRQKTKMFMYMHACHSTKTSCGRPIRSVVKHCWDSAQLVALLDCSGISTIKWVQAYVTVFVVYSVVHRCVWPAIGRRLGPVCLCNSRNLALRNCCNFGTYINCTKHRNMTELHHDTVAKNAET